MDYETMAAFDEQAMNALQEIKTRLYADKPLTGDERRDLANRMGAILSHAVEIPYI